MDYKTIYTGLDGISYSSEITEEEYHKRMDEVQ